MIWLGIETANAPLSIALMKDGKVIAEIVQHIKLTHSAGAMPAIAQLCQSVSISPQEIDAIAVSEGPGAYTGVRIGVTIAKTLAWTLQKPLVGVSSLEVLAANGQFFNGIICPLVDARRQHVYTALYDGQTLQCMMKDGHYFIEEVLQTIVQRDENILFIGEDVALYKERIQQVLGERAIFAPSSFHLPRASKLIERALVKELPEIEDTHSFVPQYRRIAEAEANWLEEQKEKK